jgi:hypothetical protein
MDTISHIQQVKKATEAPRLEQENKNSNFNVTSAVSLISMLKHGFRIVYERVCI